MNRLTFTENIVPVIITGIDRLFPGVKMAIGVYFDHYRNKVIVSRYASDASKHTELIADENLITALEPERNHTTPYSWVKEQSIVFESRQKGTIQLKIDDEFDNQVLLLRIPNSNDNKRDLLYLYVGKDRNILDIELNKKMISTAEKSMIARFFYNTVLFIQNKHQQDLRSYILGIESRNRLEKELKSEKEEHYKVKESYRQSIRQYALHLVTNLSEEYSTLITLSDEAIQKICDFKGNFSEIEGIIRNAAVIAGNRNLYNRDSIQIGEYDLIIEDSKPEIQSETQVSVLQSRYDRTMMFLDRYEVAVRKAIERNLPLTGKIIGSICEPPISPAAITDSIKKHRKSILFLFDQHPEKWKYIRNKFKPVMNIYLKRNVSDESKSA